MLSNRDLKTLRAALIFFAEELLPHGVEGMQPYFYAPLDREPTASKTAELQSMLENCRLRLICIDSEMSRSLDRALFTSVSRAEQLVDRLNARGATVLLSETDP